MYTQVLISQDANALFYTANASEVKSVKLYGCGRTLEEAVESLNNAYREAKKAYEGDALPDDLRDLQFKFVYNAQHILSSLPFLNLAKICEDTGINPTTMRGYRQGRLYISPEREREIREAVYRVGERICKLCSEIEV